MARDNLDAAHEDEDSICLACDLLSESPFAGQTRTDLASLQLRFWLVLPHKAYFIVYDPETDKKPGADCGLQATGKPVYLTSILTQE